jgi:hypothetical protein
MEALYSSEIRERPHMYNALKESIIYRLFIGLTTLSHIHTNILLILTEGTWLLFGSFHIALRSYSVLTFDSYLLW